MDNFETLTHHHQVACKHQREIAKTLSDFTKSAVDGDVSITMNYFTDNSEGAQTVIVSVDETAQFLEKLLAASAFNRLEVEEMIKEHINKVAERENAH